mmetsp:Transcript_9206/g.13165  ORF Transcript_9206/g.13165 Transcript_9206/m.13165 type:complete len:98 (+) Transcript_9206:756-1049(+)
MRVWKVWYDDARNHLRHNMERDTPGEEHDRQLFKYVVDFEKEEDEHEQHRLALQQHIHSSMTGRSVNLFEITASLNLRKYITNLGLTAIVVIDKNQT